MFLFSHFSAVDLASTEHCCNSNHLLLLWDPQTVLTCIQVLKFRLKPSLNGRRSGAFKADDDNQHLSLLISSYTRSFWLFEGRAMVNSFSAVKKMKFTYLPMHRLNRFFLEHGEFHWFFGHSYFTR